MQGVHCNNRHYEKSASVDQNFARRSDSAYYFDDAAAPNWLDSAHENRLDPETIPTSSQI